MPQGELTEIIFVNLWPGACLFLWLHVNHELAVYIILFSARKLLILCLSQGSVAARLRRLWFQMALQGFEYIIQADQRRNKVSLRCQKSCYLSEMPNQLQSYQVRSETAMALIWRANQLALVFWSAVISQSAGNQGIITLECEGYCCVQIEHLVTQKHRN